LPADAGDVFVRWSFYYRWSKEFLLSGTRLLACLIVAPRQLYAATAAFPQAPQPPMAPLKPRNCLCGAFIFPALAAAIRLAVKHKRIFVISLSHQRCYKGPSACFSLQRQAEVPSSNALGARALWPRPLCLTAARLRSRMKIGQLGDVDGDPPSFVAREQVGGSAPAGLLLIIDVAERLLISIADDEARAVIFKVPWWREAAAWLLGHAGHLCADKWHRPEPTTAIEGRSGDRPTVSVVRAEQLCASV
jgi:hypothetical protein